MVTEGVDTDMEEADMEERGTDMAEADMEEVGTDMEEADTGMKEGDTDT